MLTYKFGNRIQSDKNSPRDSLQSMFKSFGPCHSKNITFNPPNDTFSKSFGLTSPTRSGFLDRDNNHKVFFEAFGDPSLPTVLLVHGGPGAPFPHYRKLIDPTKNHIVFVHQRGSGQSTPTGHLVANHTQALISDQIAVLNHLNIERFAVQGHSWGGPLGLAIAGTVPERVDYVLLRGPANGDMEGAYRKLHVTGPEQFPDYWHALVDDFSEEEKEDLVTTLYKKIVINQDEREKYEVMQKFANLNDAFSFLHFNPNSEKRDLDFEYNLYKLYFFYIQNNFFLGKDQLGELIDNIQSPVVCVHGRHDRNCFPSNSSEIAQKARNGLAIMVEGASHYGLSEAMVNAIIKTQEVLEANFRPKDELKTQHRPK